MKQAFLKYYSAIIMLFCTAVLVLSYGYGVKTGLNTRITAGFELDGSSIAIALSRLQFGLHEGYIGYEQAYSALNQVLVPDHNPNNVNNFKLLSDPLAIQAALDNVRNILPASLPQYSFLSRDFVNILMEDVGLADFYTLAFSIFGVHADSMYKCYFLLLTCALALFLIEYRKQFLPLTLIAGIIAVFPIFFFSNAFTELMPSVNANRFMSNLGFIPIAYVLCMLFKTEISFTRMRLLRTLAQALLFTFALSIRSSAQWQLIALTVIASCFAIQLLWQVRHSLFQLERLRILQQPLLATTVIFILTVAVYQSIQQKMLNSIYQTDSSRAGHMFWHAAYVGLGLHPDWVHLNPSPTAATDINDGIALHPFGVYMRAHNLNPLSPITGTYIFNLHELVTKQEFIKFIRQHKAFTLQLYGYYKPKAIVDSLTARVKTINPYCLLYCFIVSLLLGLALTQYDPERQQMKVKYWLAIAMIFTLASWLPGEFAYPRYENGDDLWMLAILSSLLISLTTYAWLTQSAANSMRISEASSV